MKENLQLYADRTFLALALYREARGESHECKIAVACSIMNRVGRPSWWGKDVMSVLFKKWQYSSLTASKDPQLTTWPQSNDPVWQECLTIADQIFHGELTDPVPGADSYYDISIPPPNWTKTARFVAQIGRIKFYDVDHDYETNKIPPIGVEKEN